MSVNPSIVLMLKLLILMVQGIMTRRFRGFYLRIRLGLVVEILIGIDMFPIIQLTEEIQEGLLTLTVEEG
jgi:membrane glycosyltransferase